MDDFLGGKEQGSGADHIYLDENGITEEISLRVDSLPGAAVDTRLLGSSELDLNFGLTTAAGWKQRHIGTGTHTRSCDQAQIETAIPVAGAVVFNEPAFIEDFYSAETEATLRRQFLLRDGLNVRGFPSLVLKHDSMLTSIRHDYLDFRVSFADIQDCLATGDD